MANKNDTHSFYREIKSSFYEGEKFNKQKAWKTTKKVLKWSFYFFFMLTAIWGCVNEFILKTGGGLSQNIEFYQSKSVVVPNIYRSESTVAYERIGERDYYAPDDEAFTIEGLEEMPFAIVNPNYGDEDAVEEAQVDQLIIPIADVVDSEGNSEALSLAYQVTKEDPNTYIELLFVNNEQLLKTTNYNDQQYLVLNPNFYYSVPVGLEDYIPSGDDLTWTNLYAGVAADDDLIWIDDSGVDHIVDPKDPNDPSGFFIFDDDDEIISTNGYAVPETTPSGDWQIVETALPTAIDPEAEAKYLTNYFAFTTGTEINSYEPLSSQTAFAERVSLTDSQGNTILDKSINDFVNETLILETDENDLEEYNGEYTANFDVKTTGAPQVYSELSFGEEYFIVGTTKQDPLVPTRESLTYMYSARNPNWAEQTTPKDRDYLDARVQNAGWGIFDDQGNLVQFYDTPQEALEADPTEISNNGNYLYADQRTDWVNDNQTSTKTTFNNSYVSFEELLIDYSNPNNPLYTYANDVLKVGDELLLYSYSNPFIGMGKASEISGIVSPEDQFGTVTAPYWQKQSGGGYLPDYDKYYQTPLDQSISSVGYNGVNGSHAVFAGWDDWGRAWSIDYGPLYGFFLFPISQLALMIQSLMPIYIWGAWGVLLGVFLIVFLLRGLGTLISFKTASNQQKMQEVQIEVAKINAKYEKYGKNPQMKQRKQMEIMALYRKHEINPLGSFGTIFITMPIFITMWILISSIPQYKVASIGAFSFSVSSFYGIFNIPSMFFFYLMVGVLIGLVQGISAKLPGWLAKKRKGITNVDDATKQAMKKSSKTQNIMIGVFVFIGLTVPTLLAFYWIASSLFTICLELGRHFYKENKAKKLLTKK